MHADTTQQQPKKVTVLHGSPRKKSTHQLIRRLESLLAPHAIELKMIQAYQYEVEYCRGCLRCVRDSICPIKDQFSELQQELLAADGLILASPVYMSGVSARLKNIFDRSVRWYHRPELVGRPILVMATTGATGLDTTLEYLEEVGISWGMHLTGRIGRAGRHRDKDPQPDEYMGFVRCLHGTTKNHRPNFRQLLGFQKQRIMALKVSARDRAYWREKGWDKRPFFYPCRIDLHKRMLALSYFEFLNLVVPTLDEKGKPINGRKVRKK